MGFLSKLFGREDAATADARRIYATLMTQSRLPAFYGSTKFSDNYDGRIDVLTLHIAAILSNLNKYGQNGERLGQALFDEMKDDFEIALREEALSDASVMKQIKPMISLFYDRVKKYVEALNQENSTEALQIAFTDSLASVSAPNASTPFASQISDYLIKFDSNLSNLTLGQIALTDFTFPNITA